jgi:hypothetical protein
MVSVLAKVEMFCIERLTDQELIQAVRARAEDLPVDLMVRLEEQSIERLQLMLLAGRLIHVLRRLGSRI